MTFVPRRRTLIVLVSLVGSMTLASGMLLLLEPNGGHSRGRAVTLSRIHQVTRGSVARAGDPLFETAAPIATERWQAIVIHDSGTLHGSAATIDRAHRRLGRGELGYHFVINNGLDAPDGQIQRGPRWRRQDDGNYATGPDSAWLHGQAIGICLIGDFEHQSPTDAQERQLVWLVQRLQRRLDIPSDRVYLPVDLGAGPATADYLPAARLRSQWLTRAQ